MQTQKECAFFRSMEWKEVEEENGKVLLVPGVLVLVLVWPQV